MNGRPRSLGRILLWAASAAVVLSALAAVLLWTLVRDRLHDEAVDHGRDLCRLLAGEIAAVLLQPATDVQRAQLRLDAGDPLAALEIYLRTSPLVTQVLVLDRRGRVTGSIPEERELVGLDWSRQPFLQGAGSGVTWSDTYLSPERNGPAVTVTHPWRDGLVALRLDLSHLNSLSEVITPPPGGFIAVVDRQGVVIAHSQPEMAQRRESLRDLAEAATGTTTIAWRGREGLFSHADIPATAWSVLVFQPTSHAFATARAAAYLTGAALAVMIALFVALALVTRTALHHALTDFAAQMHGFAAGRIETANVRHAEFQPLADSFAAMAATVRSREAELERSRAEFRDLVEGAESVILRWNADGRIAYLNPAGERLFGWSCAEAQGKDVRELIVPARDAAGVDLHQMIAHLLREPERYRHNENVNVTRSGDLLWMAWSNRPVLGADGRLQSILSVGTDISEQRRQDEAFRALLGGMAAVSGDALFDAATASLEAWLGCRMTLIARVDGARMRALSLRTASTVDHGFCYVLAGTPCHDALSRGWYLIESGASRAFPADPDLERLSIEAYAGAAIPGPGGSGAPVGVLACLWDRPLRPPARLRAVLELVARRIGVEIERGDALRELEASRSTLQGFLAHLPGPAAITAADGTVLAANGGRQEVLDLAHAGTPADKVEIEIETGAADDHGEPQHWRIIRFPMSGGLTGHLATDETERHALNERLAHSERLDSLGKLAGGVAHDFNNQLAGIMGFAELLGHNVAGERERKYLDGILAAAKRSAALTAKLLAFARKGGVSASEIDVHVIIAETMQFAERTIDRRIVLATDLAAGRHIVLGDPGLFQNAILNLVLNARDAMPEGGRLRIATAIDAATDLAGAVGGERIPPGEHLRIDVADTGIGMDAAVRARLFEPFFTTKPLGKGNGLGLSAVYGTITAMRGCITVTSAPGQGTTFTLRLPLADARTRPAPDDAIAAAAGRAHILLAEDDDLLRDLTCDRLEALGYHATPAVDGADAVAQFRASPASFDLIILDLVMPRMNGVQALAAIRAQSPWIPVVITSGYGADADLESLRAERVPILAKPYDQVALARVLQEVLAQQSGRSADPA